MPFFYFGNNDNTKNRVIVTDNANDKITRNFPLQENDSILTYGMLTHVEKIDKSIIENSIDNVK